MEKTNAYKLDFVLSENMSIQIVPDRFVKSLKIKHVMKDGNTAIGIMSDKKEIGKLIIALNSLL